jgi:hypothetical protein
LHDRVEVFPTEDVLAPIGYITLGSERSGAIWNSGECIAEYYVDESGGYVIVPIVDNRKTPPMVRGADPLLYLLNALS